MIERLGISGSGMWTHSRSADITLVIRNHVVNPDNFTASCPLIISLLVWGVQLDRRTGSKPIMALASAGYRASTNSTRA